MPILKVETPLLRIAYQAGGPEGGDPVLLLHGWPDDATTYDGVAPLLHRAGYRTFAPWLRGFGPTTFLSAATLRSGQIAALAQDTLDLADALGLERFAVIGHDWGARIAYLLASVHPERVRCCAALSVAWQPGVLTTPSYPQAHAYWYQWFLATRQGVEAVQEDGRGFARYQWESWGPPGWFEDSTFDRVADAFKNPDWADVTVHSYRVRWGRAEPDPRYDALEEGAREARHISIPTLMLQGAEDRCLLPASSEGKEGFFTGGYERRVLPGIGHFPTREDPRGVAELLIGFLGGMRQRS